MVAFVVGEKRSMGWMMIIIWELIGSGSRLGLYASLADELFI